MRSNIFIFCTISLLAAITQISQVNASCQCAGVFTGHDYDYWRNQGCNDIELQAECQRAEFELVDFVDGFIEYGTTVGINDVTNVTFQDGKNLALLAYALEVRRPVPDCATGLFTKHPAGDEPEWDTQYVYSGFFSWTSPPANGICYSPDLLDECKRARDGVTDYAQSIKDEINVSDVTQEFIDLVNFRVDKSILPTITCETSLDIIGDTSGVSTIQISSITISLVVVITVMFSSFV